MLYDDLDKRDGGGGEVQEGEDTRIHTADSLRCIADTNNIIKQLYPNFKKKRKKSNEAET